MSQESHSDDDIVSFVQIAINSVCALEMLMLLRRERQRSFFSEQLVRELRSSELAVAQALDHLRKSGIIEEVANSSYRYRAQLWTVVVLVGVVFLAAAFAALVAVGRRSRPSSSS